MYNIELFVSSHVQCTCRPQTCPAKGLTMTKKSLTLAGMKCNISRGFCSSLYWVNHDVYTAASLTAAVAMVIHPDPVCSAAPTSLAFSLSLSRLVVSLPLSRLSLSLSRREFQFGKVRWICACADPPGSTQRDSVLCHKGNINSVCVCVCPAAAL